MAPVMRWRGMDPSIRIGTAGWSIPAAHRDAFPAEGSQLERYAARFDAVEINSSFYRPHKRETYARWAASVPPNFRFAVKLPKTITHQHRLSDTAELLTRFLDEVAGLGEKLAVLLVQLPPSFAFDPAIAKPFFADLAARTPAAIACEPRHASWFTDESDRLLAELAIARVAADPALILGADLPGGASALVYMRWHGSPRIYWSPYEPERLAVAAALLTRPEPAIARWCILDNTAAGHATGDALTLGRLTQASGMPPLP